MSFPLVAAVMLVKDEADIIGYTVEHLLAHVDHVYIDDNGSTDRTYEILEELADNGRITLGRDTEVAYKQAEKTSRLAQQAFFDGYSWVVPCDADEWWYVPSGGRIGQLLRGLPPRVLFVRAQMLNHVPTSDDDTADVNPFTRLRWRIAEAGAMTKVACRTGPNLVIDMGNHEADNAGIRSNGNADFLLAIRHLSWRSEDQYEQKIANGARAYAAAVDLSPEYGGHWKAHGLPDDPTFSERVREHYREWFHFDNPEGDDRLVLDPVPR